MPDVNLGTKHECFACGAKFYDLGRPGPVCPKCGADQTEREAGQRAASTQSSRQRRKPEVVKEEIEVEEEEVEVEDEEHEELVAAPLARAVEEEAEEDEDDDDEEVEAAPDEPLPELEGVDLDDDVLGEENEEDDADEEEDDDDEEAEKPKEDA